MIHKDSCIEKLKALGILQGQICVEPLDGGITNLNYLVADEAGRYVLRICEDRPALGISRSNEAACQRAAWRLGLAPELIHREDGMTVSRFVPGRSLAAGDLAQPDLTVGIARLLRRLHGSRDSLTGEFLYFCPFQTIRTYAASAASLGARLPAAIDDLLADARSLARRIAPFRPVLCHNDLLPANFIFSGEQLWLVDWEYAGMGHPLFDLASVSAGAGFNDEQDRDLLEAYRGGLRNSDLHELRIFRAASSLREALWGLVQSVESGLSFDYHVYADANLEAYRRARAAIAD